MTIRPQPTLLLWIYVLLSGALVVFFVVGCGQFGSSSAVKEISVEALHDSLRADPSLLLVDVRTPAEWETARAQGIKKYIEHDQIAERVHELGADTGTAVFLICRSGHRSMIAAQSLARLGYKHLFSIKGGTNAWVAGGLPVDSGKIGEVTQ